MIYKDILDLPLKITGYPWLKENNTYNRIPDSIMPQLRESFQWVAPQPSGGTLRFKTDSQHISISADLYRHEVSENCPNTTLSGFDVYADGLYIENLTSNKIVNLKEGIKEIIIYFPLQNPITSVKLGIDDDAQILPATPFENEKPVLFYGSSITCGFCASRPGLTYPAKICRKLNLDFINLGFGGNAWGEEIIAQKIASLDISCFVLDYDFNAPTPEHLEDTHNNFYKIIRDARPDLPIIIISAPTFHRSSAYFEKRRDIIKATYERALAEGDNKVTFIDGHTFFPDEILEDCTVDLTHPNDLGFNFMADRILPEIKRSLF